MNSAKLKYISAMLIFGSVGLIVRLIPLPSAQIALGRGGIGGLFLLLLMFLLRKKISLERLRADLWVLIFSGAAIGVNWIFLFQSYRYTSIANATVCYYLAPVIVIFAAPFILKEKLTLVNVICIMAAILGIFLIAGLGEAQGGGIGEKTDLSGILYSLGAAVFYAAVIILNKFFRHVTDFERTVIQLAFASLALLPYVLLTVKETGEILKISTVILLLTIGIIHTGFAYYLYFSGLHNLKSQTAALLSYIDPLTAIILSALIFSEKMGFWQILGAILILGGTMLNIFESKLLRNKTKHKDIMTETAAHDE